MSMQAQKVERPFRIDFHSMMLDSFLRRSWYGADSLTPIGRAITRVAAYEKKPKIVVENCIYTQVSIPWLFSI